MFSGPYSFILATKLWLLKIWNKEVLGKVEDNKSKALSDV